MCGHGLAAKRAFGWHCKKWTATILGGQLVKVRMPVRKSQNSDGYEPRRSSTWSAREGQAENLQRIRNCDSDETAHSGEEEAGGDQERSAKPIVREFVPARTVKPRLLTRTQHPTLCNFCTQIHHCAISAHCAIFAQRGGIGELGHYYASQGSNLTVNHSRYSPLQH